MIYEGSLLKIIHTNHLKIRGGELHKNTVAFCRNWI